jgi:hypothetical protein
MTDPWAALSEELDLWRSAGSPATVWWRDDDAVEPTRALDRLLALAAAHEVPLALAVIPARAAGPLARRLAPGASGLSVLQHGFAHRNHAPPDAKKMELGLHRPLAEVLEELARGRARMDVLFGPGWLPVLVPPWNRIAPEVVARLADLRFAGLSADGARGNLFAAPGLAQVNTHVDIMHWEAPRGFLGEAEAIERLLGHLRARRSGQADPAEPTGLLTHHLAHDEACWAFLDRLIGVLAAHPTATFLAPADAFAAPCAPGDAAARGAA